AVAAMLALASLGLVVVYVAEPGLAYSFADGRSRLLDSWSARAGLDLAVLLPSSVRLRPATLWFPLAATTLLFASWPWRRSAPSAGDTPGAHRSASSRALFAGATALACALLALPALAASLTSRSIEIESPSVRKTGGHPDPDPWMFDRRRFPEAWMLPEGESAKARVRAGGDLAVLRVAARAILNHPGPLELQLGCGDRLLVRLPFDQHETWVEREAGPVPWEPGCELVARVASDHGRPEGVSNGLSIDRIELQWR
ncbi:MAG TPA: hypothetical protein VNB06_05310, partial [Thermoanaerobaculia bacterium]|nr:hypothetical protein [Thermoanaerobaculia bacterium]